MLYSLLQEAVRPRVTNMNVKQLRNKYVQVESSNIHSVLMSPEKKIMRVRFLSGAEYEYYNVPERVFILLLNAQSHGKEFWKRVRNYFRYKRLPDWADMED